MPAARRFHAGGAVSGPGPPLSRPPSQPDCCGLCRLRRPPHRPTAAAAVSPWGLLLFQVGAAAPLRHRSIPGARGRTQRQRTPTRWLAILAPVLGGNGIWPWTQQAAAIQVRACGPCVEALQFNACSCLSRASGKRSDRQPLQHEGGPQRCLGKLLVVKYRAKLGRWLEQKETAQRHTAEPRGAVHGAPR